MFQREIIATMLCDRKSLYRHKDVTLLPIQPCHKWRNSSWDSFQQGWLRRTPCGPIPSVYIVVTRYEHGSSVFIRPCVVQKQPNSNIILQLSFLISGVTTKLKMYKSQQWPDLIPPRRARPLLIKPRRSWRILIVILIISEDWHHLWFWEESQTTCSLCISPIIYRYISIHKFFHWVACCHGYNNISAWGTLEHRGWIWTKYSLINIIAQEGIFV